MFLLVQTCSKLPHLDEGEPTNLNNSVHVYLLRFLQSKCRQADLLPSTCGQSFKNSNNQKLENNIVLMLEPAYK